MTRVSIHPLACPDFVAETPNQADQFLPMSDKLTESQTGQNYSLQSKEDQMPPTCLRKTNCLPLASWQKSSPPRRRSFTFVFYQSSICQTIVVKGLIANRLPKPSNQIDHTKVRFNHAPSVGCHSYHWQCQVKYSMSFIILPTFYFFSINRFKYIL